MGVRWYFMDELLSILNNKYIFDIGFVKGDSFTYFKKVKKDKMSVKIKITKKELPNLLRKLDAQRIIYTIVQSNEYFNTYKLNDYNYMVIEFVVKSHIQLPEVILKDFMSDDYKLYYLEPSTKNISSSSVSTFNRELGHFMLWFEQYLSKEYETITGKVKKSLQEFIDSDLKQIDLTKYVIKIKELFSIALYRNPNFVKRINDKSLTSKLVYNGYSTEEIVRTLKEIGKFDFFTNFKVMICVNKTEIGFVTCKSNFSEIKIDDGNLSYIMPFSPRIAVMLVENSYYSQKTKEHGIDSYMIVDDSKKVIYINKYIYYFAKSLDDETVVGIKNDLITLKDNLL